MNKEEWQDKGAGHRQRLREKFLQRGIEALSDDEVLELLLTLGTPRKDCKEPARAARKRFGSLAAVLSASPLELQQIEGIGPQNGFAIHFIQAAARRFVHALLPGKNYLRSSREVAEFLIHSMRDLEQEIFKAIFLDAAHGIIEIETIATGTVTTSTIYPRELVKRALHHNAAAMVVAHNHPSGNPTPSAEDRRLTHNLFLALQFMNIRLLDHLIVAGSEPPYSFADHGLMEEVRQKCNAVLSQNFR